MNISLSPFAPENLVSRDGFGRPVPRQPAHLHTYSGRIWCLLLPISAAASAFLFLPPYAIGSLPSLSGQAIAYRWRSLPRVRRHKASSPQGSSSNGCCLCITMDQLIYTCVLSSHLFWTSGLWTYQPGSHRRKVIQDFSTFPLRCLPEFFWARMIQPFLSLVDREVDFFVLTN